MMDGTSAPLLYTELLGIISAHFDVVDPPLLRCQILEAKGGYNGRVQQLFNNFKKACNSVKREVLYPCSTVIKPKLYSLS
jgi:hypothetical protein